MLLITTKKGMLHCDKEEAKSLIVKLIEYINGLVEGKLYVDYGRYVETNGRSWFCDADGSRLRSCVLTEPPRLSKHNDLYQKWLKEVPLESFENGEWGQADFPTFIEDGAYRIGLVDREGVPLKVGRTYDLGVLTVRNGDKLYFGLCEYRADYLYKNRPTWIEKYCECCGKEL